MLFDFLFQALNYLIDTCVSLLIVLTHQIDTLLQSGELISVLSGLVSELLDVPKGEVHIDQPEPLLDSMLHIRFLWAPLDDLLSEISIYPPFETDTKQNDENCEKGLVSSSHVREDVGELVLLD